MNSIITAIILAVIQGITEWLPISSSGHLALVQQFIAIKEPVFFDVMLHFATVFVIIAVFRKQIVELVRKWFWLLIIGTIPTALIGFAFMKYFLLGFHNMRYLGIAFLVTGFLLYFTKNYSQKRKKITTLDSIVIGILQGLAVMPGISRSGATISMGIFRDIDREQAAAFSFVLAIPAILGATAFEMWSAPFGNIELVPLVIGMIVAFIVGYIALTWLLKVIKKGNFHYFSYYCFLIGVLTLIISFA